MSLVVKFVLSDNSSWQLLLTECLYSSSCSYCYIVSSLVYAMEWAPCFFRLNNLMSRGSSFLFLSTGCGYSQSCFIGHSICKYGLVLELVVVVAGIVLGMICSVLRVSVLLVCLYMHFPFCQSMVVHSFVCQFVFSF